MLLSLCGVISGCENFVDIALYGEEKLDFLRTLSPFEHGIPSHDTLCNVFRALDPEPFGCVFATWAIDGKTSRGSKARGETPLHLISAYCVELKTVLGQRAGAHEKNEIQDIPPLLDMLYLKGAIVTLDAMGCQREIAAKICEKKADYVLALKGNQGTLYEDVRMWFAQLDHENMPFHQTVDGDKGRIETRIYHQSDDIGWLRERHSGWCNLNSIGRVVATREIAGKATMQTRYFISSMALDPSRFGYAIRAHWAIENSLHWVMDVTFRDDDSRVRKNQAPANFAIIKHAAMNYIKRLKDKRSLRMRRKIAGWNNQFLLKIIQG